MDRLAYKVHEAAALVGISRSKFYELIAAGDVPVVRLGASIRIPADAFRVWLTRHTTTTER